MNKYKIKRMNKDNLDFYETRIPLNLKEAFFINKPDVIIHKKKNKKLDYALRFTSQPGIYPAVDLKDLGNFLLWTILLPLGLFMIIVGIFGGGRR